VDTLAHGRVTYQVSATITGEQYARDTTYVVSLEDGTIIDTLVRRYRNSGCKSGWYSERDWDGSNFWGVNKKCVTEWLTAIAALIARSGFIRDSEYITPAGAP
jgi:hypothetical protein